MEKVISKDGTPIAVDIAGNGPALILVDGAMCSRGFGPMPALARQLAQHFTVYHYDRRGRGDSGDGTIYSVEREIDGLAARHPGGEEGRKVLLCLRREDGLEVGRRRRPEAELVEEFRKKGLNIVQVDRKSFQDAVLKNVTLESMGYDKKDFDRIQAV